MATIHLLCGPVAAGKTTYALKLAKETGAIFFSIDDWMATLFQADAPITPNLTWALERVARCEAQIWRLCRQLFAQDTNVIAELGFFKREQRDRIRAKAQEAGVAVQFHYITAARETRLHRVRTRKRDPSEPAIITVSDAIFEWSEGWFEPPHVDELVGARLIETDKVI